MNLDDMTLEQIRVSDALAATMNLGAVTQPTPSPYPFAPGAIVCVETILPHYVGILEYVTDTTIVLRDASWVPSTGRYSEFAAGSEPLEVEPLPAGLFAIERSAVIGVRLHGKQLRVVR